MDPRHLTASPDALRVLAATVRRAARAATYLPEVNALHTLADEIEAVFRGTLSHLGGALTAARRGFLADDLAELARRERRADPVRDPEAFADYEVGAPPPDPRERPTGAAMHDVNCNCEECCWSRGGVRCATCGALDCQHSTDALRPDGTTQVAPPPPAEADTSPFLPGDEDEPPPTPAELAGYLMWYCGGRGCAIAYARASKYPEVAQHLAARTEKPYTPPAEPGPPEPPEPEMRDDAADREEDERCDHSPGAWRTCTRCVDAKGDADFHYNR